MIKERQMTKIHHTITTVMMLMLLALGLVFNAPAVDAAVEDAPFADQFPADTLLYASLRTDDAYIDLLDGIVERFVSVLQPLAQPGDLPPDLSLRTVLDMIAMDAVGSDFASGVRPWLGDVVALGAAPDADGMTQILLVVDVTNKDAVLSFLTANIPDLERTEEGDFTVFYDGFETYIAVNNDAMYITAERALIPFNALDGSLATTSLFMDSLAALPAESYNILLYANGDGVAQAEAAASMFGAPDLESMAGDNVTLMVGATIQDERSLILDVVGLGEDAAMLFSAFDTPVDPAFTRYIPDASMVIHGSNLADTLMTALAASGEDVSQFETISQLFQLDFQTEFLPLFSGDYALFLDVAGLDLISFLDSSAIDPDFIVAGVVLETTNYENVQAVLSNLNMLLMMFASGEGISVEPGTIAGTDALIITISDPSLVNPLEIVLAANEEVIVIVTRNVAESILSGEGGLDRSPLYQEAANYFLPNSSIVAYLEPGTLIGLASLGWSFAVNPTVEGVVLQSSGVTPGLGQTDDDMIQALNTLINQFHSLTITTAVNGDVATARFVITLSD